MRAGFRRGLAEREMYLRLITFYLRTAGRECVIRIPIREVATARKIHTVKRRVRILVISYKDIIVLYYSTWRANRYLFFFPQKIPLHFRKL